MELEADFCLLESRKRDSVRRKQNSEVWRAGNEILCDGSRSLNSGGQVTRFFCDGKAEFPSCGCGKASHIHWKEGHKSRSLVRMRPDRKSSS